MHFCLLKVVPGLLVLFPLKFFPRLCVVAHTCNPSCPEAEIGRIEVQGQLRQNSS
jgi:hypothetical protein